MAATPLFRGVAYQVIACQAHPQMATVQPGVFPTPYRDDWRDGNVEMVELTWQPQPPLNPVQPPEYQVPLEKADIIIAGGRGLRQAGWPLVEKLAKALARKGGPRAKGATKAREEGMTALFAAIDIHIGRAGDAARMALETPAGRKALQGALKKAAEHLALSLKL